MNFKLIAMVVLGAESCAFARNSAPAASGKIIVCIEGAWREPEIGAAELIATKMFARAGVFVDWNETARACRGIESAVLVDLLPSGVKTASPGALGHANLSDRVHIEVFLDRIGGDRRDFRSIVLAHVLVHEITHIIEDIPRHSESGVMKACWTSADYDEMRHRPLGFAPEDIELIQLGLAARAGRRTAAVKTSSAPGGGPGASPNALAVQ